MNATPIRAQDAPPTESTTALDPVLADHLSELAFEPTSVVTCHDCGHAASACVCSHACGVGGEFRNPFWCSPVGDVTIDDCAPGGCVDCRYSSPPLFYATIEALPLFRDQLEGRVYQTLAPQAGIVLDTGDLETEFDAGFRSTFGMTLAPMYRIEGSYVGPYSWSDRVAVRDASPNAQGGTGNLFSPFSNFGVPGGVVGLDFNRLAQIQMSSKFNSVELNVRRRLIVPRRASAIDNGLCVANSFLMGVRHLNLDETFGYLTDSTAPAGGSVNLANINTENKLIGFQIGLLSQFLLRNGQGWVDLEVKGGIFQNEASMRSAYQRTTTAGVPVAQFTGTDAEDRTSFLGELSLTYSRQLTRRLSCRLGYNAFWLNGVALGNENFTTDVNLLSLGPAQLVHDGDLVLHGPAAGLTYAY